MAADYANKIPDDNLYNKISYSKEYIKLLQIEMQKLGERDPHYVKFSEYVELYNDGKKDVENPSMKPVLNDLKNLNDEQKKEIINLFDAKILRKTNKEKLEDVIYYSHMKTHFIKYCL
jgi:hypothetical protein